MIPVAFVFIIFITNYKFLLPFFHDFLGSRSVGSVVAKNDPFLFPDLEVPQKKFFLHFIAEGGNSIWPHLFGSRTHPNSGETKSFVL